MAPYLGEGGGGGKKGLGGLEGRKGRLDRVLTSHVGKAIYSRNKS